MSQRVNKQEVLTEEFLEEIRSAHTAHDVLPKLPDKIPSLSEILKECLHKQPLTQADILKKAEINETFGWQIFNGQRKASKDNLLKLALALHLSSREANRLLQAGEVSTLYAKRKRDAILIFALDHGLSLMQTNEELFRFSEEILA